MPDPFIGQIQPFGFNFAPRGWAMCDGQLLPISSHSALFSLLGTFYGGDGRTTFALPDLRGRACLHLGSGPGLSPRTIGQKFGNESTTLGLSNLPSHTHALMAKDRKGNQQSPSGHVLAIDNGGDFIYTSEAPDVSMAGASVGSTGNSQAFNNMQPALVVNWCIALVGVYPSRN
jgi:microcystin-dependent protein